MVTPQTLKTANRPALGIVEKSPQRGTSEDLQRKARPLW